jgi:copper oxidase (laccase) domain-containing protein
MPWGQQPLDPLPFEVGRHDLEDPTVPAALIDEVVELHGRIDIVAAVHAGWKGALGGVVHSAVSAMEALGAAPRRILAVVGPCIAQPSYEVGVDFQERFAHHDPGSERFFKPGAADDKRLFDLPGFVLWRLQQARIGQAVWTGHDTCADPDRFYSNRRAFQRGEPDFGRLICVIGV